MDQNGMSSLDYNRVKEEEKLQNKYVKIICHLAKLRQAQGQNQSYFKAGDFLVNQWLRLHSSSAGGMGSVSG